MADERAVAAAALRVGEACVAALAVPPEQLRELLQVAVCTRQLPCGGALHHRSKHLFSSVMEFGRHITMPDDCGDPQTVSWEHGKAVCRIGAGGVQLRAG